VFGSAGMGAGMGCQTLACALDVRVISKYLTYNGQVLCVVAASSGVAHFLKAGKKDNFVIKRGII